MKGSDFPINVHVVPLLFNNRDILFKMNQIAFVQFHHRHQVAQLRLTGDEIHQLEHQLGGLVLLKGGSQH